MKYNYSSLTSLTEAEFNVKKNKALTGVNLNYADENELRNIENLLELSSGILSNQKLAIQDYNCKRCERKLSFYDFICTAMTDAGHDKSFIVHTLLGSKFFLNPSKPVRCSACGTLSIEPLDYETPNYGCCRADC